jgi:hypothetical protein
MQKFYIHKDDQQKGRFLYRRIERPKNQTTSCFLSRQRQCEQYRTDLNLKIDYGKYLQNI